MMQCPNCGKNNQPGAKFCESCGQDLTQVQQNLIQPIPPKQNNVGKYIFGVFIGFILSIVAVSAIVVMHNSLAQRETTTKTSVKSTASSASSSSVAKASSKKKTSASKKASSSSSERQKASSTDVEVSSSTSSQSASSSVPSPIMADGQMTSWTTNLSGTGDEEILIIQGKTSVTMSHNTTSSSGTNMHNDGTFTIENVNSAGTSFDIMNGEIVLGEVTISGNTLTLNRQGQTTTYHFRTYTQSDAGASEVAPDSSSEDNFYDAD